MGIFERILNHKAFLPIAWLFIGFALFLNGINSFISSSEYWSIYLSQKLFVFDHTWASVNLKPLFHLILSSIYLLNLNDFYHIYATKILFSLNGIFQFFLIYKILMNFQRNQILNFFLTLLLFSSPLFLANYDRIRSDQLVLTFFLIFILVSMIQLKHKLGIQLALVVVFPLIAFKHFYLSLLALFFFKKTEVSNFFIKIKSTQKLIFFLSTLALILWLFYFAAPAASYFLASFETAANYFYNVFIWIKTEWIYIYLSLFPFFVKDFRNELHQKNLGKLVYVQLGVIILLLLFPQKTNFFIAGLIPIFYLSALCFLNFLYNNRLFSKGIILVGVISLSAFSIYLSRKTSHLFTLNNPQLIAIDRMSTIITKNKLTYLDGVGVLPKADNLGCFVSPDDEISNRTCIELIRSKTPDVIIVTNRLMNLPFDFQSLTELDYEAIGPNFFIRKSLKDKYQNYVTTWEPPSLIFSSEQIY